MVETESTALVSQINGIGSLKDVAQWVVYDDRAWLGHDAM